MRSGRTAILLLGAALLAVLPACRREPVPAADEPDRVPIGVTVVAAALEDVARLSEATGTVLPWARVSPGTKIMGRVEAVPVREGDRVTRGQLLARLERGDLQAALEQARAALAMAEAQAVNADAQHRRMATLHERGSVTDKAREDAMAGARVAAAAVAQAQANVTAAEVTTDYAEIRAPLDGVITRKRIEVGDMVPAGSVLFTMEDLSRVKVVVTVPESDVVGLSAGAEAHVTVDVLDRAWDVRIDRVIPSGDVLTRTFDVQFELPNPAGDLKSGMFARATFEQGRRRAVLVPDSAVVVRGQLRGLFVLDGEQRARLRWVRLGRTLDGRHEVLSGLAEGDRYVVAPPPDLADGAAVREA